MHENSLFAILLRSPWWLSVVIGAALFAGLRLLVPALYAFFFALPFLVIGGYALWKQLRAPSAESVSATLERLRAMDWDEFSAALESALRREGYEVARIAGEDAELELRKGGRVSLVCCKRWKAANAGAEPLRRLKAAAGKREADECVYVAAGASPSPARASSSLHVLRSMQPKVLAYSAISWSRIWRMRASSAPGLMPKKWILRNMVCTPFNG